MAINTLNKQSGETKLLTMPFANKMAAGETISSLNVITIIPNDNLTAVFDSLDGQNVLFHVSGGATGKKYKVTVIVTTSSAQILENEGYIEVIDI